MNLSESSPRATARIHLVWAGFFVSAMTVGYFTYKLSIDKAFEAAKGATDKLETYVSKTARFAESAEDANGCHAESTHATVIQRMPP